MREMCPFMPETLYKLQPHRTVHLRGFDALGAAAAFHSVRSDGFVVSGVFRDPADFAVLVLYDADNFFEHPRLKYLPDFNFDGLSLEFEVEYEGLMPLNSRKYPNIDWPFLDVLRPDGSSAQFQLANFSTVVSKPDVPAHGSFQLIGDGFDIYDRVTLWYQNLAFDYIVPGKVRAEYPFYAGTPGTEHSVSIAGRSYSYVEQPDDTSAAVASHLIARISGLEDGYSCDPDLSAGPGTETYQVRLSARLTPARWSRSMSAASAPRTSSRYRRPRWRTNCAG